MTFRDDRYATIDAIYDSVPLDHSVSTNIRVIEILDDKADPRSPISLDDPPNYTALSYT
jgi:hypothetical protein